jgi:hypothetical protein
MTSYFRFQISKKLFFFVTLAISLCSSQPISAQNSLPIETILLEAQKQTLIYREIFRDLLAVETKTFEEFDKNAIVKKTTIIKSNFLVYQSGKDVNSVAELRNVFEVNGKLIPNGDQRAEQFLAELGKTSTAEKELKKIEAEGSRYDKTWLINGLTLNEGVILAANFNGFVEFQLIGTENYLGNEVYIIAYRQVKQSPDIKFNLKNEETNRPGMNFDVEVPNKVNKNDIFLRGKLFIDAKTFKIWREEQESAVQNPAPLVLLSIVFEYQSSDFEILTPKKISLTLYRSKQQKNKEWISTKAASARFEYSNFRKTNVEIRVLDNEEETENNN